MYFTDRIAHYIKEKELDLKNLTIIIPSERAKKYVAASLYRCFQKPILAPDMITIDRWIKNLSDQTVIDKTRTLIKLFHVHLESPNSKKDESFDEFLSWGSILLNDYDEIDRYLLSSEQVFKNLTAVKELENWEVDSWSFEKKELSEVQKRFMEFWDRLPIYYQLLNERLADESLCYIGKAYRFVAEQINVVFQKNKNQHFLFAGFNALSPSEIQIMKQLIQMGRGHLLIDADNYYIKNKHHEAGRFLRNTMDLIPTAPISFSNSISDDQKTINVIECAQQTGQIKVAATILKDFNQDELNETLILLADEQLIAPLLKNLPKTIGKANITLGLPLRDTPLKTWIDLIFAIQENKQRFKTEALYIHDLQKFWNHPFLISLLSEKEKQQLAKMEASFIQRNAIFLNVETIRLGGVVDKILGLITFNWNINWGRAIEIVRQLNETLFQNFSVNDSFERAIIHGFDVAILDFENLINEGIPEMNLKSFKHLFQQHWNSKSVAYHGNPTEGLQIMGLLETRLLDFKNCLILGFNEGKLPPTNPIQTMIPMDLRAYFGLPTPRDKQGIFAHHFYRLLHHCEKMWITFTTAKEAIGSNEASRYLAQLEMEIARANPKIMIQKSFYAIPNETVKANSSLSVKKTKEIISRMDELFSHSVSASALKKYMNCPLDFYYRYLLDFKEENKIEEEIESNTFGTIIHNVLEELYEPFARHDKNGELKKIPPSNITPTDIDKMLNHFELLIFNQFLKQFDHDKTIFASGKNHLSHRMAIELTKRILEQEKCFLADQTEAVFIEYLEAKLNADLEIEIRGSSKKLHFTGIIDRIDSIGGKIRIIDYKSGKVSIEDVTLPEVKDESQLISYFNKGKYILQLTMYCYLFKQRFGELPSQAGIYSLINVSEGVFNLTSRQIELDKIVAYFPDFISELLVDLYNIDQPFEHQSQSMISYCTYCE